MKIVLYLKHCVLAPVEPVLVYTLLGAYKQLEVDPCFRPLEVGLTDLVTFYEIGVVVEDAPQAERTKQEIKELEEEYKGVHGISAFEGFALIYVPPEHEHYFRPIKPSFYKPDGAGPTSINQCEF